jgi:hypothetical protein
MKKVFIIFPLLVILTACKSHASPAEYAMQKFLQALVNKDEMGMVSSVCSEYEMAALLELDSFASVETSLKSVTCKQINADSQSALVVCQGSIEASYNGEMQSFDLSGKTYVVLNDNGNWLVCGYTK